MIRKTITSISLNVASDSDSWQYSISLDTSLSEYVHRIAPRDTRQTLQDLVKWTQEQTTLYCERKYWYMQYKVSLTSSWLLNTALLRRTSLQTVEERPFSFLRVKTQAQKLVFRRHRHRHVQEKSARHRRTGGLNWTCSLPHNRPPKAAFQAIQWASVASCYCPIDCSPLSAGPLQCTFCLSVWFDPVGQHFSRCS